MINDISITDVVYDYMLVQVTNPALHAMRLQYVICKKGNQNIIRKGSFTGQVVQLRVSHMPEGVYDFCIAAEGQEPFIVPFEKRSESFEQYLVR
jgi:hypothetical protein